MRSAIICGLVVILTAVSAKAQDEFMKIDNRPVTLSEFENIYKKNNSNAAVDQKSLEEYLELFINFKLKVREAEELGLDTVAKFQRELAGYRKQLAKPYLVDKQRSDELVKEAYERMKQDVAASHLLVRVAPDAPAADTQRAYDKIMNIRGMYKKGEKFEDLAKRLSEDPSSDQNMGDLGYFSAFAMVYPFENGAYSTPVGEVSMPVRSRFGYHLVFVRDKRPARGEIRVAHILTRFPEKATDEQKAEAEKKAKELYGMINAGEEFEKVARLYSDDKKSASRGGELPRFGTGRMFDEFEEAAFGLKKDQDISEPFATPIGWHIVKRLEKYELGSFEDMEQTIKSKIARDGRDQTSVQSLIAKLKKNYDYWESASNAKELLSVMDSTYFERKWKAEEANDMDKPVIRLKDSNYKNEKTFTQADFAAYLAKNQRRMKPVDLANLVEQQFTAFADQCVLDFEDSNLENKYPAFKALMQEYRDGILLFELMDQKVWSKAVNDSAGLNSYFIDNRDKFMWKDRVDATIYICGDAKIAKKVRGMLDKQKEAGFSNDSLQRHFNTDSQFNLRVQSNKYERKDQELVNEFKWTPGLSENKDIDGKVVFVNIHDVVNPEPKELYEARGLVTADYQLYLEAEWIKSLRKKYKVKVDRSMLSKIN